MRGANHPRLPVGEKDHTAIGARDAEAKAWNGGDERIATRSLGKSLRHGQRGGRMDLVGHE